MNLKEVFNNNKEWVKAKLKMDSVYFEELSKDQAPSILYFGCSDSRVVPEAFMGFSPGEVFVHRNIGNLVTSKDRSAISVLAFAITQLQVKEIIVCGHYDCGAVSAAMSGKDYGVLNEWIADIKMVMVQHKGLLDTFSTPEEKSKKLVELNVIQQCNNIYEFPGIAELCQDEEIAIHGWVFDIHSGKLIDLKVKF